MEERINKLKAQIEELLQWKRDNSVQQVTIQNFGPISRKIYQKDKIVFSGKTIPGAPFDADFSFECQWGDLTIHLPVSNT